MKKIVIAVVLLLLAGAVAAQMHQNPGWQTPSRMMQDGMGMPLLVVTPDGTAITTERTPVAGLVAYRADGTRAWMLPLNGVVMTMQPAAALFYVVSFDTNRTRTLTAVSYSGAVLWEKTLQ